MRDPALAGGPVVIPRSAGGVKERRGRAAASRMSTVPFAGPGGVVSRDVARPRTSFVCQQCGAQFAKWLGRCSECDAWDSVVEEAVAPRPTEIGRAHV